MEDNLMREGFNPAEILKNIRSKNQNQGGN